MLNNTIKDNIKIHSRQEYPNECCGLLINTNNFIYSIPCKNISETPEKSFIIDNKEINKYNLDSIIGFYHSHKDNPDFSLADVAFSEKLVKKSILYCNDKDIFKIYEPTGAEIPYIGRPFFIGTLDCFTLFQDYYKRELNIIFNDTIHHKERYNYKEWSHDRIWNTYGYITVIKDYLLEHDFIKVNNLQEHDILEIKIPNIRFPTHIAMFLKENRILHHLTEFSQIEAYNNAYKRMTVGIYRHISLL